MSKIGCVILLIFLIIFNISCKRMNINVIEKTDPSLKSDYSNEDSYKFYYEFPERHQKYKREITEEELERQIKAADANVESTLFDLGLSELQEIILKGLNIGFLLEGINERELVVTTIAETDHGDYLEKKLLFEDEEVGRFDVLILVPKGKPMPLPAIIALHGHGEDSTAFRDKYMGIDLLKAGFVVIMPTLRQMGPEDARVSKELLLNGFTLMGIGVYESALLLKYLQYLDYVDNERIGIIGHSGGSTVAILLTRLTSGIKGIVRDTCIDFMDDRTVIGLHCETIPHLSYYRDTINSTEFLSASVLHAASYGFENETNSIIEFFKKHLKVR